MKNGSQVWLMGVVIKHQHRRVKVRKIGLGLPDALFFGVEEHF